MKILFLLATIAYGKLTAKEKHIYVKNQALIEKYLTKAKDDRIASLDKKMKLMREFINWEEKECF